MRRFGAALARLAFGACGVAILAACGPQTSPVAAKRVQAAALSADPPQAPAAYRGSALAWQVCAQCHDIATGSAPSNNLGAPSFSSIANRPEMTGEKLVKWLASSHPSMPNFIFDRPSMDDLAAYIMSLRKGA